MLLECAISRPGEAAWGAWPGLVLLERNAGNDICWCKRPAQGLFPPGTPGRSGFPRSRTGSASSLVKAF